MCTKNSCDCFDRGGWADGEDNSFPPCPVDSTRSLSAETLQRITTLAMEKAVSIGMVPRFSSQEKYLMYWDNMTEVVKTILSVEL